MKREIIHIDEDKCNGCGLCIPNCHEGALQIIDKKARLISDLFCDGLGACIGHCPQGAITMEEREAEIYDERKTMIENIIPKGENTIMAHLKHMKDHNQVAYLKEAAALLEEMNIPNPLHSEKKLSKSGQGCPGSQAISINRDSQKGGCPGSLQKQFNNSIFEKPQTSSSDQPSMLKQWPVQLHLINPKAPYFQDTDLLIAADCTAYAYGGFHSKFMKNKSLIVGCPKLDSDLDRYVNKITSLIDEANINTITVVIMEVPCCGGMLSIIKKAQEQAKRKVPVKKIKISIQGEILEDVWI